MPVPPDSNNRHGDGMEAQDAFPELHTQVKEVQLYGALARLWQGRYFLFKVAAVFLVAGVVFLFGSRREFESGTRLMPERQGEGISAGAAGSLLQQFGGMLGGIDAGGLLKGQHALPVEIYPEIVNSPSLQLALLRRQVYVPTLGDSATLYAYLDEHQPFSLWEAIGDGILKTPSRIKAMLSSDAAGAPVRLETGIIHLSLQELDILMELQERLNASLDKKTGVLTVSVLMPDPYVAAQAAEAAVEGLTEYLTNYRLEKLRQNLTFIEERHDEARRQFNASLDALARFKDRNQNLMSRQAQTEEQRLEAEYNLAFNVYNSLSSRREEARIQVQEETPVFQMLDPVTVPLRKKHPRTVLVLLLSLILGAAAGSAWLLIGPDARRLWHRIRHSDAYRTRSPRVEETHA